ncbi:MAG: glycosyltransferase family 4 protein [Acidimicrobiales bacterium]
MRILYVTPLYLPFLGGLEVICGQLLEELRDRGHEVAVVTGVNSHGEPLGVREIEGVPVLRVDAYHVETPGTPMETLLTQRQIRDFVDDFGPDVAHAHDGGAVLWLYQLGAKRRRPLLMTLHVVVSLHTPDRLALLAKLMAAADWVTGVSEDVVADTVAFAPEVRSRISTVRNAVASPGAPAPLPDGPAELLCLGRLVAQKGFDRALDALAVVVRRRPDVHLTIAGSGPDRLPLAAQISRLGLGEHVSLVGRVEHRHIKELISAATAVVMPSRFEGLPLVALEAAWLGRPVVATDAPGLRCAIDDNITGIVVKQNDDEALADGLLRLIEDRALAQKLGANARAAVEQDWTLGACVDEYESLYERLVDGRAS